MSEIRESVAPPALVVDDFLSRLEGLLTSLVLAQGEPVAVTKKRAAQMLGMSDAGFVDNLIRTGKLRAREVPGKTGARRTTLVSTKSIHEFMDGKRAVRL